MPASSRMASTRCGVSGPCSWIQSGPSAATCATSVLSGLTSTHAGFDPAAGQRDQLADRVELEMARRAREMHEADHVGAGLDGGVEDGFAS